MGLRRVKVLTSVGERAGLRGSWAWWEIRRRVGRRTVRGRTSAGEWDGARPSWSEMRRCGGISSMVVEAPGGLVAAASEILVGSWGEVAAAEVLAGAVAEEGEAEAVVAAAEEGAAEAPVVVEEVRNATVPILWRMPCSRR
jgi:hypothetical protein